MPLISPDVPLPPAHLRNEQWYVDLKARVDALTSAVKFVMGTPENDVIGTVGNIALRVDGGAGTTLYVKQSGVNTNTGWVGK